KNKNILDWVCCVAKVRKYHESALIEADILRDVNRREAQRAAWRSSLCVDLLSQFDYQGHCCLVFECLGQSLYDYLKKNAYRGFPMGTLRPISLQLLQVCVVGLVGYCAAIDFLHSMKLIHTDLKPENVLLRSRRDETVVLPSGDSILVPSVPEIK
ncbi:unnamed protein product, partial [Choristocarpus tenellus]